MSLTSSLRYATSHLPIKPDDLIARIGTSNQASIALFHSLGFATVKVVEVFSEAELRFDLSKGTQSWQEVSLVERTGKYAA